MNDMQLLRRFGIFIVITMVLSSCTPVELMVGGEENAVQSVETNSKLLIISKTDYGVAENTETNECLNCHSDKNRLIKTADPVVEEAESESSGVG